jgi:hypothetical protein
MSQPERCEARGDLVGCIRQTSFALTRASKACKLPLERLTGRTVPTPLSTLKAECFDFVLAENLGNAVSKVFTNQARRRAGCVSSAC